MVGVWHRGGENAPIVMAKLKLKSVLEIQTQVFLTFCLISFGLTDCVSVWQIFLVCQTECLTLFMGGACSRWVVRPYIPNSCPAHNFIIWSWTLQLFHRNDHYIETTCHAQHLGRYLEGQGHSMTLQQNRVWPIDLLLEVGFYNYFTEMITILRRRVTSNIWVATLFVHLQVFLSNNSDTTTGIPPVSKTYSGSITRFTRLLFLTFGKSELLKIYFTKFSIGCCLGPFF
jgi:hypothetical protein